MDLFLHEGHIVKGVVPNEPVRIIKIKKLGNDVSLNYVGVSSGKQDSVVILESRLAELELVTEEDTSNFKGNPERFLLFAEAERINSAYQFDPLFAVNCSIVDPLPHQIEAVYKYLLPLPKIRFLLADDTGAGKTIMTGLLIKELFMRKLLERVLIITPGGLTKQWQEDELEAKFSLSFELVNRSIFTARPDVFHSANRLVASIDFISRPDVLEIVKKSRWDLIVFDECHKLSAYEFGTRTHYSKRYEAAAQLAKQCEHLLLLTATPHRGRSDTFKKLMQLLDEDIFPTAGISAQRVKDVSQTGANKFFIRRLKEDMKDWSGNPLFKKRTTRTVAYELTPGEKELYDEVTKYLSKKKEEADQAKNVHVSLALTVMQRRLTSSIYAIKTTLGRRHKALQELLIQINENPKLWKQRDKVDFFDDESMDPYERFDELSEKEKDALDEIYSDRRKLLYFTTATNEKQLRQEADELQKLHALAETLYNNNQEEQKFKQLQDLLKSYGALDSNEKLVIFTEHKDTLLYLEDRLKIKGGYKVVIIHGGLQIDERRKAQWDFAKPDTQILIATDAAGEGINLQFCRLLINWDIPWNPNRLEQRMGRIHRYGQKQDVLVFNMVASNTREGKVLDQLLTKLDVIRAHLGDDRVYDVIQDVFENISLDSITNAVFKGEETDLTKFLSQDDEALAAQFTAKIKSQSGNISKTPVDYKDARRLKEESEEKKLQPIFIKLFFEKAFKAIGGTYEELKKDVLTVIDMSEEIIQTLNSRFKTNYNALKPPRFCFNKQIFLEYQNAGSLESLEYMNPGNIYFDSLIYIIRQQYREDMLKGTVLISPEECAPYYAFYVKSQIKNNRIGKDEAAIADEQIFLVHKDERGFFKSSPAKFIDLYPPTLFAKTVDPPEIINNEDVINWTYSEITEPQFQDAQERIVKDTEIRISYLQNAFTDVILDFEAEINDLQGKTLRIIDDSRFSSAAAVTDKIRDLSESLSQIKKKRERRIKELQETAALSKKEPEVMGCAYVIPLTSVEYEHSFNMKRDDEVEAIAMETAMEYERNAGWTPADVSKENSGYDIRSSSPEEIKRYIEVKGRSGDDGSVMLSENEMNRLAQLGDSAWLYIVMQCKTKPELFRINNPAKLSFDKKIKGVQYLLVMDAWKSKAVSE